MNNILVLSIFLFWFIEIGAYELSAQTNAQRTPNLNPLNEYPRWLPPTQVGASDMAVQEDGTVHLIQIEYNDSIAWINYANNRIETRTANGFSKYYRVVEVIKTDTSRLAGGTIAVSRDGRIAIAFSIYHLIQDTITKSYLSYNDINYITYQTGQDGQA